MNANGEPGFVRTVDIMYLLKTADEKGELVHAREWQEICLDKVKD